MQPIKQPGITLVLGTGLLKSAAALGVVQVLEQENIPINSIIGSSTGALFAVAIALGWPTAKTQAFYTEIAANYKFKSSGTSRIKLVQDELFNPLPVPGLINPAPYRDIITREFGAATFADAKIPLQLVASNFVNGQRVLGSDGALWPYLQANAAIPGFMPPVDYNGQRLADGALVEPLPISAASLETQVVIGVGFELTLLDRTPTRTEYIYQMNAVMVKNLFSVQMALNNLAQHSEIILVNPRFGLVVELIDLQYIPFIIEKGAEATQQIVPYLRSVLSYQP